MEENKPLKLKAIKPLTQREREMHKILMEAFPYPEFIVLSQVSFQAFLEPRNEKWGDRNRINRKYADFLICTLSFFVIAVVELDDSTHDGREKEDAERDAMVRSAGILTVRYREYPSPENVRSEVMEKKKAMKSESDARKEAWARK